MAIKRVRDHATGTSVRHGKGEDILSLHTGGAHFAFADGSVRFLKYSAAPVMPALATRAGGESVGIPD